MTRPALADVLAVLAALRCRTCGGKGWIVTTTGDGSHGTLEQENCPDCETGWAHAAVAEAVEALVGARLLPAHWLDPERAPRWWCRCGGAGDGVWRGGVAISCAHGSHRRGCGGAHWTSPDSHPVLVAVASLGVDTLARAEAIVAEAWRARLVWRVMTAEEIREHHGQNAFGASVLPRTEEAFSWEAHIAERDNRPWRAECPFGEVWGDEIRRTWPASTALRALNLHLLAVDDGRVTLGVEALP